MSVLAILHKAAAWDITCFRFINDTLYWRPLADLVVYLARDQALEACLLAGSLAYIFRAGFRRFLLLVVWGGAGVVASNLAHNYLLKPFFNRPRPFMALSGVHVLAPLNDLSTLSMSFPSTHAASAMALAVVAAYLDNSIQRWTWLFAVLVGLGAIYSGGHYPGDVVAGWLVGALLGWGLVTLRKTLVASSEPSDN
jgi:membrane-associated phospholipid phosphatase